MVAVQGQAWSPIGSSEEAGRDSWWQQYRGRQGLSVAAVRWQAGTLGGSSAGAGMESCSQSRLIVDK